MADPYFAEVYGVFGVTVGSTDVTAGDPVYFDGTDWELADSADNTKFAEAFMVETFKTTERGVACMGGVLVDTDAPYTQGNSIYLSTTATTITVNTATRPTGAENLAQILGYAVSTSEVKMAIPPLHEETINLMFPYQVSGAPQDRDNDFCGIGLDDTSAEVGATFMCPQNLVENVISYLWWVGTGTALDASDTYVFDVSGGIDDETTSATTDTIAAAALTVAANDIARADVSAGFDGAGIAKPGNLIGAVVKKAAEGTGGDDPIMCCISFVYRAC
jgi:hypothetical protein